MTHVSIISMGKGILPQEPSPALVHVELPCLSWSKSAASLAARFLFSLMCFFTKLKYALQSSLVAEVEDDECDAIAAATAFHFASPFSVLSIAFRASCPTTNFSPS